MLSMKRSKRKYAKTNETAYVVDETAYNAPTEETAFIRSICAIFNIILNRKRSIIYYSSVHILSLPR